LVYPERIPWDSKTKMSKIKAAVIGLGKSGLTLDLDSARKEIWTHSLAIKEHKKLDLVAVVDEVGCERDSLKKIGITKKTIFFKDSEQMIKEIDPEFVSICTPANTHLDIVKKLNKCSSLKYIYCEKPVGISAKETKEIIAICKNRNIILGTNYMRRWEKKYIDVREKILRKEYGNLLAINANGATALYTSASHLIDLMIYFSGKVSEVSGKLQTDYIREVHGNEDFGANAFLKFENGATGHLKATSKGPEFYMFEIDILFEEGRIEIKNDGNEIIESKFVNKKSNSGSGFMTLEEVPNKITNNERLLSALTDITNTTHPSLPKSNGENALEVQKVIQTIIESSNKGGVFKKIG